MTAPKEVVKKFTGNHKNNEVRRNYIPNLCLYCNKPILPQPYIELSRTRKKKFCSVSCSAKSRAPENTKNLPVGDADSKPRSEMDRVSIRGHSRRQVRHRPKVCQNCGYDKYIEICHIKAIKDFAPDELVSVVNHIDNLLSLCRNCHHEFDHGILSLSQIQNKSYPLYGMFK